MAKETVLRDLSDLSSVRELLAKSAPRNTVVSSLYSVLPTTLPGLKLPVGDALVLKSDMPVLVRFGRQEEIRDVFDLIIPANVESCEVRRQNTGTFPDCRFLCYALAPKKILNRWQREIYDYPNTLGLNQALDFTIGTTQNVSVNLSAIAQESIFMESFYLSTTGTTAPISRIEFLDVQGSAQRIWAKNQIPAGSMSLESGELVKLPVIFTIRLTYATTAGANAYELIVNYKFR